MVGLKLLIVEVEQLVDGKTKKVCIGLATENSEYGEMMIEMKGKKL